MSGQVVIIAGGKGTRLAGITGNQPKAMVDVGGRPLLEHQLLLARRHGFENILLLTGFGAEQIENYFEDGHSLGVRIRYVRESRPLGTAGAVIEALPHLAERFVVMYGDTMLNVDLRRMWNAHPKDAAATLFLHPNDHPHDSDLVEIDDQDRVVALHPYPHPPGACLRNLVNAALYTFERSALLPFEAGLRPPVDFGKHVLPAMIARGAYVHAHRSREYIKDAGTPERLERVRADEVSGRIEAQMLGRPMPALFFDRDGTLNYERHWLSDPAQLDLIPGAAEAVRRVNEAKFFELTSMGGMCEVQS